MHHRVRRLARFGWRGWVVLLRRAAPWGLLAFALFQVKTLSDKVRQVEEREFQQVQDEVSGLRGELKQLRADAVAFDKQLTDARATLGGVNDALDRAHRRAPELARLLGEAKSASEKLPEEAAALAQGLSTADGQVGGVLAGLPSAESGSRLSSSLAAANKSMAELSAKLPEAKDASALASAVDADKKRLDELVAGLPKAEAVSALAQQLDADAKALGAVRAGLPSDERVRALEKDLTRAEKTLQGLAALEKESVTPQAAAP